MIPIDPQEMAFGDRRIRLWTALGADTFQLVSFSGCEGISKLYSFELRLRTDTFKSTSLDQWLGQTAVVEIQLPDEGWEAAIVNGSLPTQRTRRFCGVISEAAQTSDDELYRNFRASFVPRFWFRTLGSHFRAYHQKDTRDIVSEILEGMDVRWDISGDLPTRNYCVQYGESDFHFISRLLEQDGLFYFFEHQYDGQADDPCKRRERLVICDTVERLQPTLPVDEFEFDNIGGGNRNSMRIRRWKFKQRVVEPNVESIDRHFQIPNSPLRGTSGLATSVEANGNTIKLKQPDDVAAKYLYPGDYASRFDDVSPSSSRQVDNLNQIFDHSNRDAQLRSERLACKAVRFSGAGDVAAMTPGFLFKLREGIRVGQPFYITDVEHHAELSSNSRSGRDVPRLKYKNRFACLPKTITYRPPRTHSRPKITGTVTATVVNDASVTEDQICVDRYGRIKVKFPWQMADDSTPSCWVRVAQLWAGNRWGAFFWPRSGHEVLIAFEHGDPDRPLVVGSVYNSANMPPLVLPKNKMSSGIHSCTHHGNPLKNFSAVVFHDQPEHEFLQIHSETYESITSETESLRQSAGKQTQTFGHSTLFDVL